MIQLWLLMCRHKNPYVSRRKPGTLLERTWPTLRSGQDDASAVIVIGACVSYFVHSGLLRMQRQTESI